MKKILVSIVASLIITAAFTQEQSAEQPSWKVTSFGSSMGFSGTTVSNTAADFKSLAGNVEDPDFFIDPDKYTESKYNYGVGGNGNLKFYLGLTPMNKKTGKYRMNQELRINLGFSFGARRTFSYINRDTYMVDSFTSSTGQTVYADSSIFTRMTYAESYYGIDMGFSYLFKTNPERRFHFHTGFGLDYGFALRSFVNIQQYTEEGYYYYNEYDKPELEEPDYDWMSKDDDSGLTTRSTTNMKGNLMFLRPYIPLGINFRIANKTQSFFNQVYLFTEINPGIEFQFVGKEKTYFNPYFGVAVLGFTYRW
jgi:hypothetical protein